MQEVAQSFNRVTWPTRNSPHTWDHRRALGIVPLQDLEGWLFLIGEVLLYQPIYMRNAIPSSRSRFALICADSEHLDIHSIVLTHSHRNSYTRARITAHALLAQPGP